MAGHGVDLEDERGGRGVRVWMLATGVLLVVIGFAFLLVPLLATILAGIAAGALLTVAGIAQIGDGVGHAGAGRGWAIAVGVLATIAGIMLLVDPRAGMVGLTALLAGYLVVSGAFRLVLAAAWRPTPGWGWALLNGLIALALGIVVLVGWPETGFWMVGLFLGIDAVFAGFSRVSYAISEAGRYLQTPGERS